MRKKYEESPSKLKIIIQKDSQKNTSISPLNIENNPKNKKFSKYNHFHIKMKDYGSLMLTTKSINSQKNFNTIEY